MLCLMADIIGFVALGWCINCYMMLVDPKDYSTHHDANKLENRVYKGEVRRSEGDGRATGRGTRGDQLRQPIADLP